MIDPVLDENRYYGTCMGCGAEHVLGHGKAGWMTACAACCAEHLDCAVCRLWLAREKAEGAVPAPRPEVAPS